MERTNKVSDVIWLGNMDNDKWSTGFGGNVYSIEGISPTLNTCQGGGREPRIVITDNPQSIFDKEQDVTKSLPSLELLGCLEGSFDTSTRVYSASGLAPTLAAAMGMGGNNVPLFMIGG